MIRKIFESDLARLNHIRRYSSYPVIRQENVAEHTYWVCVFSFSMANDLIENKKVKNLDMGEVLSKALWHDVSEAKTGDIVRTFKYYDKNLLSNIRSKEQDIVYDFLQDLFGENYLRSFQSYMLAKNGFTGQIVAISDFFGVIKYCVDEIRMGNTCLKPILKDCMITLNKAKFDDLLQGYITQALAFGGRYV